ncbi:hypothetical protein QBC37DRAFT_459755 [Rhypophila decipiens]|uniref:Uncharacterized protein n=1 Tax=Rhypophila decipiens TaxID=261697 RepID=A0AAN6XTD3_9PEZI|nr:hypothetical protein QBC37DRAFT_459755 [Rhypophila decipiens]
MSAPSPISNQVPSEDETAARVSSRAIVPGASFNQQEFRRDSGDPEKDPARHLDEVMSDLATLTGINHVRDFFDTVIKNHVEQDRGNPRRDEKLENPHLIPSRKPGNRVQTIEIHGQDLETAEEKLLELNCQSPHSGRILIIEGVAHFASTYSTIVLGYSRGGDIINTIVSEMDRLGEGLVVILAGRKRELDALFTANPRFRSRFSNTLSFEDFDDQQLHSTLLNLLHDGFGGQCQVQGGQDGPYIQALVRRLARGRGTEGFRNAREIQKAVSRICARRESRLRNVEHPTAEGLLFVSEDLLGPSPSELRNKSMFWAELQALAGLQRVKEAVERGLNMAEENYQRELRGRPPLRLCLNRFFVGPPGTGKKTVARLYGRILADMGLLRDGERRDLGESETKTQTILDATVGKVLLIHKAHMLGSDEETDRDHSKAILETIVSESQRRPDGSRCIILEGYEEQMQSLFSNSNPGLTETLVADQAFRFEDYTIDELGQILMSNLNKDGLKGACGKDSLDAAMAVLAEAKHANKDFGNAREVEDLVQQANLRYFERQCRGIRSNQGQYGEGFIPADFDPRLGLDNEAMDCKSLLGGKVSDAVLYQLESSSVTETLIVARELGILFHHVGLLSNKEVVECQASDLIGENLDGTTPTRRQQLEMGLGKVLVVNGIHTLSSRDDSHNGNRREAFYAELVSFVRMYWGKLVMILTGPSHGLDDLMGGHPELAALFRAQVTF